MDMSQKNRTTVIATLLLLLIGETSSYRILLLFPYSSTSHMSIAMPLVKELADRGNNVTIVHPLKNLQSQENIDILYISGIEKTKENRASSLISESGGYITSQITPLLDWFCKLCEYTSTSEVIQSLLKAGKQFDVAIVNAVGNECAISIAHLLAHHVILLSAGPIQMHIGSPTLQIPSAVPNNFLPFPSRMNFLQRILNTASYVRDIIVYNHIAIPRFDEILHKHVPTAPGLMDAYHRIVLTITNSDHIIVPPRATVPNIVTITCPHCRKPKPLPKDLQDFVDGSGENGYIIFGLGSVVPVKSLPEETVKAFLDAFSRLKQRVIWKFEDDSLKNVPPNVRLVKWMPQQDLLGHPKIRLILTHCGMLSLQEAVYHGVPVMGFPIFWDQIGNMARLEELGLGRSLRLHYVTNENLYNVITSIVNDHRYSERMKVASKIFRDQEESSARKGAFWVEYVARHNGAHHLRTFGEDMSFFQYFLIDVGLFIAIILGLSIYALKKGIMLMIHFVSPKKIKNKTE